MIFFDLNCDLGERSDSAGELLDVSILQWITSANVACGAHAGSVEQLQRLAAECRRQAVSFGAHPGYRDREGFGRRIQPMSGQQIIDLVAEQVRLAANVASSEGIPLAHVKPHGALYNLAAVDFDVATAIAHAVRLTAPDAALLGLSGSHLIAAGKAAYLVTRSEVFADRNYHADGSLVSREHPAAVLHSPEEICDRATEMLRNESVMSIEGTAVPLVAETICVHSDTVDAIEIVRLLQGRFLREGFLPVRFRNNSSAATDHSDR